MTPRHGKPTAPRIALKVDVPTFRAAHLAVPVLFDILRRHHAGASFVFALGPDRSGKVLSQAFRPQRFGRPENGSLLDHFGGRSLLYGTLLPAPSIGKRSTTLIREIRDAGFEVGLHGWDALEWVMEAETADATWSAFQLEQSIAAFEKIFAERPKLHAAPGWRTNPHALRLTQREGFAYASDSRGRHPFVPVWNGEIVRCAQFPTTLPTLEELADTPRPDPQTLRERLLAITANPSPLHVFSLRAGPAVTKHPEHIEELLTGWREQGYEITSIQTLAAGFDIDKLPRHEITLGSVPGRCGSVMVQGEEFLSTWRHPT